MWKFVPFLALIILCASQQFQQRAPQQQFAPQQRQQGPPQQQFAPQQQQVAPQQTQAPQSTQAPANCASRVRRSWYSLSDADKTLYVQALQALKASGEYDIFAQIHFSNANNWYAHGNSGFFVWHRKYMYEFENALRSLGPQFACITCPYWPFETEAGRESQSAIYNYFGGPGDIDRNGCITHPNFAYWKATDAPCVHRTFNTEYTFIGEARIVDLIVNNIAYGLTGGFRSLIEGAPHAAVHNYIGGGGGHMGTMASPNDPYFFLLHSNIDRLFAIWEDCHDYERQTGQLSTNAWPESQWETMPFLYNGQQYWRFVANDNPRSVYNIQTQLMAYTYDPVDRLVGLISSTAGQNAQCDFNWFSTPQSAAHNKRALEQDAADYQNTIVPPSQFQYVNFSDPRVQQSYDSVCTVEIPYAPKLYQIHVTAIAECNICTGHGVRRHASDSWITMQRMSQEWDVFQPICKGDEPTPAYNATAPAYAAPTTYAAVPTYAAPAYATAPTYATPTYAAQSGLVYNGQASYTQ